MIHKECGGNQLQEMDLRMRQAAATILGIGRLDNDDDNKVL